MPPTNAFRAATSGLLKALAILVGIAAALVFWVGGRALHEFAGMGRMSAEGVGLCAALVLGMFAAFLKALGDHVEECDDGQPISILASAGEEKEQPK